MKQNKLFIVISLLTLSLLFGCANSVDVNDCLPQEEKAGFWSGTWDGMISTFSFIGSLFNDNIAVYDVNNNGAWYDFGFIGGLFFILNIILSPFKSKE
jgi:hypothetical protein